MPTRDEVLAGGNTSAFVVRRGRTVRKPWHPSSESVQRLLAHLHGIVGDLVPRPLGQDAEGRQVLEFVPGTEAMSALPLGPEDTARVGADIRSLHTAASSFARRESDRWNTAMRRPGDEIVSHNDLAPWNLICGEQRRSFIDWDGAGPTTRIADLAYAARAFALIDPAHPLDESIPLLRAVLCGYDAAEDERAAIVPAMIERTEAMRDLLRDGATTGHEPWASMAASGHEAHWAGTAAHLRTHREALSAAVRSR